MGEKKKEKRQQAMREDIGNVLKRETMLVPALEDDYNYLNEL